jgi:Zn-finger nucleic acid-binding protein
MKCPECSRPLRARSVGDTVIDECQACRAIWFDPGEIDEVKDEIASDLRWMDFSFWREKARFEAATGPLFCPRCGDSALVQVSEHSSGASVRLCAWCGGQWLGAVDFAKILDMLHGEADRLSAAGYWSASLKEARELLSGRGRSISQWKDLKTVLRLLKYRFMIENPQVSSLLKGLQKSLPL